MHLLSRACTAQVHDKMVMFNLTVSTGKFINKVGIWKVCVFSHLLPLRTGTLWHPSGITHLSIRIVYLLAIAD